MAGPAESYSASVPVTGIKTPTGSRRFTRRGGRGRPGGRQPAAAGRTMPGMADCLFCRIVAGEVPATVVRETDRTVAFRDIAPQAPTHVLVVPREHHENAATLAAADAGLLAALVADGAAVAAADGLEESGYRPGVHP